MLFYLLLCMTATAQGMLPPPHKLCIDCTGDSINQIMLKARTSEDTLYAFVADLDNHGGPENNEGFVSLVNKLVQLNNRLKLVDTKPYELYRDGVLLWDRNEKENSIKKLKEAIEAFDRQKKILGDLSLLNALRVYLSFAGLHEERLAYYQEKLKYYQENGPLENMAACYHAIAGYYVYKADYNLAISNYLKAADCYKDFSARGYCNDICAAGKFYYEWGNYERSQYYLQIGHELARKTRNWNNAIMSKVALVLLDKKKKDYSEALKNINESLELCDQLLETEFKAISLAEKGGILLEMNKPEEAYQVLGIAMAFRDSISLSMVTPQGNFEGEYYLYKYYYAKGDEVNAEKQLLTAYDKAIEAKSDGLRQKYSKELATFYSGTDKPDKAIQFALNYIIFGDSLREAQNTYNLAKFENEQKEQESEKKVQGLQIQKAQQRNYFVIGGALLLLLSVAIFSRLQFMRRMKKQLEAKNIEVEAARRRAEASEAFKSRFLANMSHEIRTPLHGIAGFTDLVLETSLSEKQRRYLSSIHHSTERLTEVVNDILDISKLEAGEVKLRQVPFSPARIAHDVQEALSVRAENKGIGLTVHIGEGVPAAVLGDPTRLYQILMNLAGNAVKFTENGEVRLMVDGGRQMVDGSPAHALTPLTFSLADSGIGIPSEKLATIFDSFQQAGEDTTARFGGTGLGLTIARELVQLHGSDIQVESSTSPSGDRGAGSTFSFVLSLPLADAADLEAKTDLGDSLYFSQPLRILLADDNSLNREIATEAIRRHFENAEIVEAVNGKETVELLGQQAFDIVLMDMQMPKMNGIEATRHIRQQFTGQKQTVPIIALTASATPEEIEKALESGMNRHLGKPFKPVQLAQVIAEVLGLSVGEKTSARFQTSPTLAPVLGGDFDLRFLRDFCKGDEEQVQHFIQKFKAQCPLEIKRLEAAFEKQDREAIYQAAHSFKPQLEFVGLKVAAALAMELEKGAKSGAAIEALNHLFGQLKEGLTAE